MTKRHWIVVAVMAAALAAATAPFWVPQLGTLDRPTVSRTEILLDTAVTVTVSAPRGEGERIVGGAMELIERLGGELTRMEDEEAESGIAAFNRIKYASAAAAEPDAVSMDIARISEAADELLKLSLDAAAETGGAFDPALGRMTELWDFTADAPSLPSDEDMTAALRASGYERLERRGEGSWSLSDGAKVDLGAIAKGYIADRAVEYIAENGAYWAAVNLGGNVSVYGTRPDKDAWSVGIRDPAGSGSALIASVEGDIKTAVTSGDYERRFELDGTKYFHILDPATGYPARSGLSSVTVIGLDGSSSALADAYSTALFVMGAERALEFIESKPEYEAVLVSDSGEIMYSSGVSPDGGGRAAINIY